MLANVLQVLPWGSVIVGHLRHRCREGNYRGSLPGRRGRVQRVCNALVSAWAPITPGIYRLLCLLRANMEPALTDQKQKQNQDSVIYFTNGHSFVGIQASVYPSPTLHTSLLTLF